jgi:phosphate acetyltransferase
MGNNLYITSTASRSGKSVVCLGLMELLHRKFNRVGFFRPIVNVDHDTGEKDNDIELISTHFQLDLEYEEMYGFTSKEVGRLLGEKRDEDVREKIFTKYARIEAKCDFILVVGTDLMGSTSAFEFDINAELANHLNCPILLIVKGRHKDIGSVFSGVTLSVESMMDKGCNIIATIVNKADPKMMESLKKKLIHHEQVSQSPIYFIPHIPSLARPSVAEIAEAVDAKVIYGKEYLHRNVQGFTIAAMQLRNFLKRMGNRQLIVAPGDRADIILACLATLYSRAMPDIAGLLLTGGLMPDEAVETLIKGVPIQLPILVTKGDTFPTARIIDRIHSVIKPDNIRKINHAIGVFEKSVNSDELSEIISTREANIMTPKMFEYRLIQMARVNKQHIVLPEGSDERIIKAAEILSRRDVVDLTLLGNREKITQKATRLGLQLNKINLVDPMESDLLDDFGNTYHALRSQKGVTRDMARETMQDVSYFGTMMIHKGIADGMVSGAVHTTGATIRPAFEFVKTKPGISVVSSVFFMCLKDRVLVYGDCAVNPNPDAWQLAQIALSSAQTAKLFGIEPRVAMLSYSTGKSGKGEDVDRVREATSLAQQIAAKDFPDLKIEGPIQYDAAVDIDVARTKMPESEVAGRANVFIFPDLNTGNNTYKAVQRSAKAVAVGPILQGLKKPVNDLSRGCLVPDIVNTVAITAIQAQSEKGQL